MYKVRVTNRYIFINAIRENKNPQFENFSKNELIEMLNILSDEYRNCYQRNSKAIEYTEVHATIYEPEMDNKELLQILKGEKDEVN